MIRTTRSKQSHTNLHVSFDILPTPCIKLLLRLVFNKYRKRRVHNTANLLTGESDVAPGSLKVGQGVTDTVPDIISYYHPNVTVNLVEDYTQWAKDSVPQPLDKCKWRTYVLL